MRRARVDRRTKETEIQVTLNLDGRGRYEVRTGVRFLDHMLELVARHGAFDLAIAAKRGGVGYYQRSNFVHIDTGAFRTWVG